MEPAQIIREVAAMTTNRKFARADVERVQVLQKAAGQDRPTRIAIDAYFNARRTFNDSRTSPSAASSGDGRRQKEALVARAAALLPGKNLGQQAKQLTEEWKKAPSAGRVEDQKLWVAFRAALDAKFAALPAAPARPSKGRYESSDTPARRAAVVAWLSSAGRVLAQRGVPVQEFVSTGWSVEKRGLTRKEVWVRHRRVVGTGWALWRTKEQENALATADHRGRYDRKKWAEYWEVYTLLILTPTGQLLKGEETERRWFGHRPLDFARSVEGGGSYDGVSMNFEVSGSGEQLIGQADWYWRTYNKPVRDLSQAWAKEEYRTSQTHLAASTYGETAMAAVERLLQAHHIEPPRRPS